MNNPIVNRSAPKRGIVIAMMAAIAMHLAAVAVASFRHEVPERHTVVPPATIIGVDDSDESSPPEIPILPDTTTAATEFAEARLPSAIVLRKPGPIRPRRLPRNTNSQSGDFKALAINAPRPAYPYEARMRGLKGSGVIIVSIDPVSGAVVHAEVEQSVGSPILDSVALSAFRRWRFKPGAPATIRIPITFSLSGAQF